MFDRSKKRFYVVISKCNKVNVGVEYKNIKDARDAAKGLSLLNEGVEFLVCGADSSYVKSDSVSTHYY